MKTLINWFRAKRGKRMLSSQEMARRVLAFFFSFTSSHISKA